MYCIVKIIKTGCGDELCSADVLFLIRPSLLCLLPPIKEEVNVFFARVYLSVCLLARLLKTRAWIWVKCCVSTDVGTWTNWMTFEPDPDYSPDAGTGLLSPMSYKRCYAEFYVGKIPRIRIGCPSLQRRLVLKWFYALQGRSQEFILTEARGLMASAGTRAYNGGLGRSPQRDPGAEPLVRGSGGRSANLEGANLALLAGFLGSLHVV